MARAVLAFARFQIELFFKTFIAVFFTYLMPCAIFGAVLGSMKGDRAVDAGQLLPLFLGLMMVFVAFYTLATQVVTDREAGFYKRLLVTQLTPVGIAFSTTIRGFVLILIGLIIMLLEVRIGFGVFPQFNIIEALIAILIAGAGLFMVAMIPASLIKRSSTMFAVASVISYVLVFFSGVRPPIGKAETWARLVDHASPTFYALQVLRAGFSGSLFHLAIFWSFAALVGFMALSVLVVRRYFTWM